MKITLTKTLYSYYALLWPKRTCCLMLYMPRESQPPASFSPCWINTSKRLLLYLLLQCALVFPFFTVGRPWAASPLCHLCGPHLGSRKTRLQMHQLQTAGAQKVPQTGHSGVWQTNLPSEWLNCGLSSSLCETAVWGAWLIGEHFCLSRNQWCLECHRVPSTQQNSQVMHYKLNAMSKDAVFYTALMF